MKSPVYGYTNRLATQQTPKPEDGLRGKSNVRENSYEDCYSIDPKYTYSIWQSLKLGTAIGDSGTISKRPAWRCVDCGAEREPTSDSWECCSRCGSTTEPRWCNGQAGSECDRIEAKASMPTTEKRADARRDQGTCSGNQSGVERCGRGEAESAGSAG